MDEPKPFQKKVLQGGNIKFNPEKVKKMADEIYCKYCGTRLEERDRFCPECGSLVPPRPPNVGDRWFRLPMVA